MMEIVRFLYCQFLECPQCQQNLSHICCVGYGSASVERRIAVIKLAERPYASLTHLVFKSDEHAVYIADTAHTEHSQVSIGVESYKPRTSRPVVHGHVALFGRTQIEGSITV